ncbi:MAG: ChaN family lipoprotein [Burkholderiales bacterium]
MANSPLAQVIPEKQLESLLPTQALLLGEQHDATEHQTLARETVEWLSGRGQLAALVIEMAQAPRHTAALPTSASPAQVRDALAWSESVWPWKQYGPVVMAAVSAGVPVLGANLPLADLRAAMLRQQLDDALPGPALKAQQQAIRLGHCGLLPESQIAPMTRIQIARDQRMAQVLQSALVPGKVALLVAGSGHVDKQLGVPQHLPSDFQVKVVVAQAGEAAGASGWTTGRTSADVRADAVWLTPALPEKDYCADFKRATGAQ